MNRVYNELCKVIISDIPISTKESADSQLISRVSISETSIQEEIIVKEDSNQSTHDDYCNFIRFITTR